MLASLVKISDNFDIFFVTSKIQNKDPAIVLGV